MAARSRLTFIVQSESLTGEEISQRLRRRPTHVTERGDPICRRSSDAVRREHTTWELASPLNEDEEPAAHLAGLLPVIEPMIPALRQIEGAGGSIFWSCFVTAKPTGNVVWLEPQILSRLAQVGITFAFDIYDSDAG